MNWIKSKLWLVVGILGQIGKTVKEKAKAAAKKMKGQKGG